MAKKIEPYDENAGGDAKNGCGENQVNPKLLQML
jgi:hypothetical protein